MNLSGTAVKSFLEAFSIAPKNCVVVFDFLHIPFGSIKLKTKGTSGGHKGMENILQLVGPKNHVNQLRVGIGPVHKKDNAVDFSLVEFVLDTFTDEERKRLPETSSLVSKCLSDWLEFGSEFTMNKYNSTKLANVKL